MPTNDIIDNRTERLVDHINRILPSTETARFAIGYFFLSGLESIADKLHDVKELRLLFTATDDEDAKGQINILESAFRSSITTALARELNLLRRNGVTGNHLLKSLANLYHTHNIATLSDRRAQSARDAIPQIICSEAFVT